MAAFERSTRDQEEIGRSASDSDDVISGSLHLRLHDVRISCYFFLLTFEFKR